jgi:hypothetical protein
MPYDDIINILAARQLPQSKIGLPVEFGRPLTPNPDGSVSSEYTMTTQGPNGNWFNVPTMMNGYKLPMDTVNTLFQYGLAPHVGEFPSLDTAEQAAQLRTQNIRR